MARTKGQSINSNRAKLLDIVDKSLLKKILNTFTETTDLTANIVDTDGKSIFSKEDAQKNCAFCQLIWKKEKEKGIRRCMGSYARAGKQAAIFGQPYIFRCPAGLIEWAAPIIINNEHLGTIICGQVLMWEPEEFFWIELEQMNKLLFDDFNELFETAKKLKVITGKKVQSAADLLYVTANYIMKSGWENSQHQRELVYQQDILNQEIENRKKLEEKFSTQSLSLNYALEKEREFVRMIVVGDFHRAKAIFQELLADIFIKSAASLDIIKARVLELEVILSRASVDGGADLNEALKISFQFSQDIVDYNLIEEINLAAVQSLEAYIKAIQNNHSGKNRVAVQGMKEYIRANYNNNLSLEEIADSVFLSPSYASRIFKDNTGITISDYLTKVKLEHAKKLLKNTTYQIEDIAKKLGYNDSSYFSKVFRRKEGMSPTKYRQLG